MHKLWIYWKVGAAQFRALITLDRFVGDGAKDVITHKGIEVYGHDMAGDVAWLKCKDSACKLTEHDIMSSAIRALCIGPAHTSIDKSAETVTTIDLGAVAR